MQLTRFDRWLRVRFVNEIHIYALRQPPELAKHVFAEELPEVPGRIYRFRYVFHDAKEAERLITILRDNSQMFTTRMVDRKAWYVPIIAPERKSVTWRLVWIVITIVIVSEGFLWVKSLWDDPGFRKNIEESIQTFKNPSKR